MKTGEREEKKKKKKKETPLNVEKFMNERMERRAENRMQDVCNEECVPGALWDRWQVLYL